MNSLLLYSTSGAILEVLALLIFVVSIIIGAKKGFIKSLISTFGTLLSLIFAVLLCSSVAKVLENKFLLVTKISSKLTGVLSGIFGEELMTTPLSLATEDVLSEQFNLSLFLIRIIMSLKNTDISPDTTLSSIICPVFGFYIVCIISILLLFIIFKIIFFLIGEIVKKLHSNKVIGATDITLGIVFGAIKGIISINFALMILNFIPLGFIQNFVGGINTTIFAKFINKIDVVSLLLKGMANVNVTDIIIGMLTK